MEKTNQSPFKYSNGHFILNNCNNFGYLLEETKSLDIDQYGMVVEITVGKDGKTFHRQL